MLGKPYPLFAKIEQARLEELKAKYGGQQQQTKTAAVAVPVLATAADATKAVADQAEKVRQLKASGVEKAVWQPEVELLLKFKKQLANLSNSSNVSKAEPEKKVSVTDATKAVADQAEKVRSLKASGVEKAVWQPEVDILLKLKKELSSLPAVTSTSAPAESIPTASLVAAEAAVAQQAEKVRQLKSSGADKAVWQPEVERLLSLKKIVSVLTGVEATPSAGTKKANKKK